MKKYSTFDAYCIHTHTHVVVVVAAADRPHNEQEKKRIVKGRAKEGEEEKGRKKSIRFTPWIPPATPVPSVRRVITLMPTARQLVGCPCAVLLSSSSSSHFFCSVVFLPTSMPVCLSSPLESMGHERHSIRSGPSYAFPCLAMPCQAMPVQALYHPTKKHSPLSAKILENVWKRKENREINQLCALSCCPSVLVRDAPVAVVFSCPKAPR
ncbi:hypothetical protein IWX47DRAFT_318275 [Phyllosticta citricarpa]